MRHAYHADLDYYADRAEGLLSSAQDGTPTAVALFADEPLTSAGARRVVAREHGQADWEALAEHVAGLEASGAPFAAAYRALEARDVPGFTALLDAHPWLLTASGTNGNDLLGMAGATCDERLVDTLLTRGADPTTANAHGWTPLHQAGYSDLPLMAEKLLAAGADPTLSARGDGGTPLVVALFWGNTQTAALLATHSHAPGNLRVAAGLGDAALLDALIAADGTLALEAGAHRQFYRPHGGFPAWTPRDDAQEVRDEALAWAARSDQVDALRTLVERGADVAADVNRGTAMGWAASNGRAAAVRALAALGADPSQRTSFGGPEHGVGTTALHLAAQNGDRATCDALLELGADPTIVDGFYNGTPAGWAHHGGHLELAAYLDAAAG